MRWSQWEAIQEEEALKVAEEKDQEEEQEGESEEEEEEEAGRRSVGERERKEALAGSEEGNLQRRMPTEAARGRERERERKKERARQRE